MSVVYLALPTESPRPSSNKQGFESIYSPLQPIIQSMLLYWRPIFVLLAVALLNLAIFDFFGKALLQDILLFFVFHRLFRSAYKSLPRLKSSSDSPRESMSHRWFFSRAFLSLLSVVFFIGWYSRWFLGWREALDPATSSQHLSYLNAGLLLALLNQVMDWPKSFNRFQKFSLSPGRIIVFIYGYATVLSSLLLILPWSLQEGKSLPLLDSLYIAVSALAVTGLTPVNVAETFSLFGQLVILLLIQLGGLGIIALSVGLALLAGKKLSVSHSLVGKEFYNTKQIGGLRSYMKRIMALTLGCEALGLAWIYLSLPNQMENRFFQALFHSISAFCNAGFSTLPNNLDIDGLFFFKSGVCILVTLGAVGFPVLLDLLRYIKPQRAYRRISHHSQMTLIMMGLLFGFGALSLLITESLHSTSYELSFFQKLGDAFFYTVSTRTAGFNTTPVAAFAFSSQSIIAILMIIGGAPLSTAGGIKCTTFGVMLASTWSLIKGHSWAQFRTSSISLLVLQKAVSIILLYFGILAAAFLTLLVIEDIEPWKLLFEAISALSTVGLSLGITSELGAVSKVIFIFLMLAGRLGIMTVIYIGLGKSEDQRFRYAEENYFIG